MKAGFRVTRYAHPKLKFVVRGKVDGKWVRKYFKKQDEATTYCQIKNTELLNQGREAVEFPSWLRVMAYKAHRQLEPLGKTIDDAVDFYLKHLTAIKKSASVSQVMEELIENRQSSGASRRYCNDLRLRLTRFCKDFPNQVVAEISTAQIDAWLSGLNLAPVTRNTFRRDLRTLFSFCLLRGYCEINPAANARKAKALDGEIGILTVDAMKRLLDAAPGELLPYLAIGAFAGIRSAELLRLTWDEVDFDSKLVEVTASKSKTARRRFVKIRPNLEKWLTPYRGATGKIAPVNLRKLELAARTSAKIEEWPPNALRHSFASYHLSAFQNAAELALEMGHTNQQMIFDHYRQLVKPAEAAKYWQIGLTEAEKKQVPAPAS